MGLVRRQFLGGGEQGIGKEAMANHLAVELGGLHGDIVARGGGDDVDAVAALDIREEGLLKDEGVIADAGLGGDDGQGFVGDAGGLAPQFGCDLLGSWLGQGCGAIVGEVRFGKAAVTGVHEDQAAAGGDAVQQGEDFFEGYAFLGRGGGIDVWYGEYYL